MARRLFVATDESFAGDTFNGGTLSLSRDQHHYLRTVLRLRSGDTLEVFDGNGHWASAQLVSAAGKSTRHDLELEVQPWQLSPRPTAQLHLACSVLKGQAMDRVVQKATELGVTDLHPLYTEHTQLPNNARQQHSNRLQHWQRIIESAAEQCGQNYLPQLHPPQDLTQFLHNLPARHRFVMAIHGQAFPSKLSVEDTLLMVGPEGGWHPGEIDLMKSANIQSVRFGELVLRAETAPLVGVVNVASAWRASQA